MTVFRLRELAVRAGGLTIVSGLFVLGGLTGGLMGGMTGCTTNEAKTTELKAAAEEVKRAEAGEAEDALPVLDDIEDPTGAPLSDKESADIEKALVGEEDPLDEKSVEKMGDDVDGLGGNTDLSDEESFGDLDDDTDI